MSETERTLSAARLLRPQSTALAAEPGIYYGIRTVEGGAYLGAYTLPGYDPTNSSSAQAFDGTISSVTIDDSGQLLAPITGAVPEPASWAMRIGGFGLVGGATRRRHIKARLAIG